MRHGSARLVDLKMGNEFGNIADPLAERRHAQHYHGQPEKQVFTEFAVGNRAFDILMRR